MSHTNHSSTVADLLQTAPPAGVLGTKIILGLTLPDWLLVGSTILITAQLYFLVRDKIYRPWKEKRDRRE